MRGIWYRFVGWAGTNRLTRVLHPILYRWTGGAGILGRSLGHLTILLTTTGRRSGRARTTALWTFPHGPSLVVVGTNGGSRRTPAWVLNLRAQPAAAITIGREPRAVHAREAAGDEYERLWAQVVAAYPGYEAYRDRAQRPIPLVVLEAD
jgi:F420H(2)-dependent quinone reductase